MKQNTSIIGIWDDHDFGDNNGNKYFSKKDTNRDPFLDFLGEPADSARRLENGTGIFQDYMINYDGLKIHVVLMDVRFDYDPKTNDRLG